MDRLAQPPVLGPNQGRSEALGELEDVVEAVIVPRSEVRVCFVDARRRYPDRFWHGVAPKASADLVLEQTLSDVAIWTIDHRQERNVFRLCSVCHRFYCLSAGHPKMSLPWHPVSLGDPLTELGRVLSAGVHLIPAVKPCPARSDDRLRAVCRLAVLVIDEAEATSPLGAHGACVIHGGGG